eukprot:g3617.t1
MASSSGAPQMVGQAPPSLTGKAGKFEMRQAFVHEGRTVYEWEQSMEEVLVYIAPPPGVTAKQLDCKITARHLTVGIKGNPPFLDVSWHDLGGSVVVDESMWTFDDGEMEINLQKMQKGATWNSALEGHAQMDPFTKGEVQKKMMLERFQEENPGFDFSGAEFSGSAPDPRRFMGGVKYT